MYGTAPQSPQGKRLRSDAGKRDMDPARPHLPLKRLHPSVDIRIALVKDPPAAGRPQSTGAAAAASFRVSNQTHPL